MNSYLRINDIAVYDFVPTRGTYLRLRGKNEFDYMSSGSAAL